MNRITDINSIDFPVRLDSVFIRNSKKRKYKEAIGFKAVTGKTDGREKIFSLVTDNYSLITNKQALELGRKIFREYFSKESEINLSVFNVTFPETRSFCNIDLMNNLYSFNVWEKGSVYSFYENHQQLQPDKSSQIRNWIQQEMV
ncbi:MAG: hypothetical protein R3A12_03655 [Ignavibacteria bacterium]